MQSYPSSLTPLSDLMSAYSADHIPARFDAFLAEFRRSTLGVIATGTPNVPGDYVSTKQMPMSVGLTRYAHGKLMVLAFADPHEFAKRFGRKFNAGIKGEALLATCLLNKDCCGILVNNAITESCVAISRSVAERLKQEKSSQ
jgi:hypothetical protein